MSNSSAELESAIESYSYKLDNCNCDIQREALDKKINSLYLNLGAVKRFEKDAGVNRTTDVMW